MPSSPIHPPNRSQTDPPDSITNSQSQSKQSLQSSQSILSTLTYPVSYTVSGLLRRLSLDEPPTALGKALSANYNGSVTEATSSTSSRSISGSSIFPSSGSSIFSSLGNKTLSSDKSTTQGHVSPFQPPPLTPLTLLYSKHDTFKQQYTRDVDVEEEDIHDKTHRILKEALAEEIRLLLPPRLQLVDSWKSIYSLERDGTSLTRLYHLCDAYRGKRGGFIIAIKDTKGAIFGSYVSDAPRPSPHYYGTGECFLWRFFHLPLMPCLSNLPPRPSEDTTNLVRVTTVGALSPKHDKGEEDLIDFDNDSSNNNDFGDYQDAELTLPKPSPDHNITTTNTTNNTSNHQLSTLRFKAFPYTGDNDFFIYCTPEYLSIGGGNGKYGLWLDDSLAKGVSEECITFANEPLCGDSSLVKQGIGGTRFDVLGLEVWFVGS